MVDAWAVTPNPLVLWMNLITDSPLENTYRVDRWWWRNHSTVFTSVMFFWCGKDAVKLSARPFVRALLFYASSTARSSYNIFNSHTRFIHNIFTHTRYILYDPVYSSVYRRIIKYKNHRLPVHIECITETGCAGMKALLYWIVSECEYIYIFNPTSICVSAF